jgi:hypothetical protein
MTPEAQEWLDTGLKWLAEANSIAKMATNSQAATAIAALTPGAAQVLAIAREAEAGVDILEAIAPKAEALFPYVKALAVSVNMTPAETAKLRQDRIDEANRTG